MAVPDAVIGPEYLGAIGQVHRLERGLAGMLTGKGDVIGGVPVLGEDDVGEFSGQCIDEWHDGIAIGHRQLATGQEVILHVDNDQHVAR